MRDHAKALSAVQQRLSLTHIRQLAQQAGVSDVIRLTVYYPKGDAYHSIGTLCVKTHVTPNIIESIYEGLFDNKVFEHAMPAKTAREFVQTLNRLNIASIPSYEMWQDAPAVWHLELASGTYYHTTILLPDLARLPYSAITNAIGDYLPQAIRRVPR